MVNTVKTGVVLALLTIFSCASSSYTDVVVSSFTTNDRQGCFERDVNLSDSKARQFFSKAKVIASTDLHDYQRAPCYLEGTLTNKQQVCEWKIEPLGLGFVTCENKSKVYYCDDCFE